jgi:hypothetical protein
MHVPATKSYIFFLLPLSSEIYTSGHLNIKRSREWSATVLLSHGLQERDEEQSGAIKPKEVECRYGGKPLSDSEKCTSIAEVQRGLGVVSVI